MIKISQHILIDEKEIELQFIRSSGPGGQNVNKLATAVQLRFDLVHSPSIPEGVRQRAIKLAGKQLNKNGEIILTGQKYRTQERNRHDVIKRLVTLIQQAMVIPKVRKKTRAPKKVKEKRLADKRHRAMIKKTRRTPKDVNG